MSMYKTYSPQPMSQKKSRASNFDVANQTLHGRLSYSFGPDLAELIVPKLKQKLNQPVV